MVTRLHAFGAIRFAAALTVCGMFVATDASAQSCVGGAASYIAYGGLANSDNSIHYQYRIDSSITGSLRDAVEDAIYRWNEQVDVSHMRLVPSTGSSQELLFELSNSANDPCAEFGAKYGMVIQITTALDDLANEDAAGWEWAAGTVAHEIGHWYQLDDLQNGNYSNIMGSPDISASSSCADMKANWEANNGPGNVSATVAETALSCVDSFRYTWADSWVEAPPPYYGAYANGGCFDWYEVWDYYYCYDGCYYDYSEWYYLGCF